MASKSLDALRAQVQNGLEAFERQIKIRDRKRNENRYSATCSRRQ